MKDIKIELDLDGVLVDFLGTFERLSGHSWFDPSLTVTDKWDLVITKFPDIYLKANPLPDAWTLWEAVRHLNVEVLTAIPSLALLTRSTADKRAWVEKYFGPELKVKFGPFAIDKQFHCRGDKGHILIDDSLHNKKQWERKGGTYILHTDSISTIEKLKELGVI